MRCRTTFYIALGRLLIVDLGEDEGKFQEFMMPLTGTPYDSDLLLKLLLDARFVCIIDLIEHWIELLLLPKMKQELLYSRRPNWKESIPHTNFRKVLFKQLIIGFRSIIVL